jgi:hypothetical protein
MQKTVFITLPVIIALLLAAGCRKNFILSNGQEVLFQYEYRNDSNGKLLEGYFIDRQGNVLTYRNPAEWNHPDSDLAIYSEQLFWNLDKCSISEKNISADELEKYSRYISNISLSKVSAPRHSATGTGSHRYICYRFDEAADIYKGYLIRTEGDISRENLNFYSKKIVSWMKDIGRDISDYHPQIPDPQKLPQD